jgi:hypothetical protein
MSEQPTVITLDAKNSAEILISFVEVAQKAGSFLLPEADILKRCKDVLLGGATDPEINVAQARQLLIQGVQKGQSKGAFTLEESSILHKTCQYVSANLAADATPVAATAVDEDLSELSKPVPLRTPGPKVV